jgi:hypothetical protein
VIAQTKLYLPDDTSTICVFPDASKFGWGAVVTMVTEWNASLPISELDHKPIAFYSGMFNDTQKGGMPSVKKPSHYMR